MSFTILLAFLTMPIVWVAWWNFKKLGRIRESERELTQQEIQAIQMKYVTRIVLCLLSLAILPFLLTMLK